MHFRDVWESDGMTVSVYVSDAVLYLRFTGVVSLQNYYQGAAYAAGVGSQRAYATTLVDLRRALLVTSDEELQAARAPQSALSSKWRPGAYIVPLEFEPMFKRLCWKLAHHGVERMVFTSGSAALAWARQAASRARVRAALQAWRAVTVAQGPLEFAPSKPVEL